MIGMWGAQVARYRGIEYELARSPQNSWANDLGSGVQISKMAVTPAGNIGDHLSANFEI
jgi:hypothetical protein